MERSIDDKMFHELLANVVDLLRQSGYTDREMFMAIIDKLQPLENETCYAPEEHRD
jgi:hypothetical protein